MGVYAEILERCGKIIIDGHHRGLNRGRLLGPSKNASARTVVS